MFFSKNYLEDLVLVPVSSNNRVDNFCVRDVLFFSDISEKDSFNKESVYKSYVKGLSLEQYKNQGRIVSLDNKDYFLESDSLVERLVLNNFRKFFENTWNKGFSTVDSDFISSRKNFYEESSVSSLPVLNLVLDLSTDELLVFEAKPDMVNLAKYLSDERPDFEKVKALNELFGSLSVMHEHNYVVGDPTAFIVEYSEGKAYFTNLRFAKKTIANEDFARDASQFIISGSYNSGLPLKDFVECFSNNYVVSDDFVRGLRSVSYNDSKPVNYFSGLARNVFSGFVFGNINH